MRQILSKPQYTSKARQPIYFFDISVEKDTCLEMGLTNLKGFNDMSICVSQTKNQTCDPYKGGRLESYVGN